MEMKEFVRTTIFMKRIKTRIFCLSSRLEPIFCSIVKLWFGLSCCACMFDCVCVCTEQSSDFHQKIIHKWVQKVATKKITALHSTIWTNYITLVLLTRTFLRQQQQVSVSLWNVGEILLKINERNLNTYTSRQKQLCKKRTDPIVRLWLIHFYSHGARTSQRIIRANKFGSLFFLFHFFVNELIIKSNCSKCKKNQSPLWQMLFYMTEKLQSEVNISRVIQNINWRQKNVFLVR